MFPVLALVAAGALWGSSFLLGKVALRTVGPVDLTLLRFVLAAVVLLAVAGRRPPRRADLPWFVLAGALNVPATFLVQFAGLQRTTASTAALIIGTLPPLVAVAARLVFGERLGRIGWVAVAVSTLGIALTVGTPGAGNDWLGDALVFASMLAVVGWVLLGKRLLRGYPPLTASAWIIAFGTLVLIPVSLPFGVPDLDLPASTWAAIAGLGIGCSALTTALWNWGLHRLDASTAGVFLNVEPLVGAVLGVAVLGDTLTPGLVAGGVLIIVSAVVVAARA